MTTPAKKKIPYEPHPKQLAFHQSDAKYRAIVTGVGFGKTACGAVEMLLDAISHPGTLNLILAPCYDDQSEVLTKDGWKFFKDVTFDDDIATLSGGEFLEYQKPKQVFMYPYKGDLIGYKNQEIDMLVTPNHRCYTKWKNGRDVGRWQIKTADEMYGKNCYAFKKTVKQRVEYNGEDLDWFEYLGFWFAEGCAEFNPTARKYRITVTQKKEVQYTDDLMERIGKKYYKNARSGGGYNYVIYNKPMAAEFVKYGKARTKHIPEFIRNSSPKALQRFLYGYIMGDGHHKVRTQDQTQMWTSSTQLADDLQEIALKAGYSCHKALYADGESYLCFGKTHGVEPVTHKKQWYKQQYNGFVYCVEVDNGIIFVRRNGSTYWCGNTFPMVYNVTVREFLKFCPPECIISHNHGQHIIKLVAMEGGTSEIIYLSADDETAIDRVRGLTLGSAYLDEVAICPEYLWQVVAARIRDPKGSGRAWITTTPKGFNWVYDYFGNKSKGNPEEYAMFGGSTDDNPYTPEGYKDTLRSMYAGTFAKQELYGEFIGFEGLVYSEFRRGVHIVKPEQLPPKFKEIICGVDWGWTNPTAVLWAGVDNDMRVWLLDEIYQKQLQIDSVIELIRQKNDKMEAAYSMRPNRYLCDPSAPENIDKLKTVGFNAKPSDNEVLTGISSVGARLSLQSDNKPRLFVADKCVNTIYEFETYRYKDKKEGRPEKEEPLKVFDHCFVAGTMVETINGERPIESIKVGDLILTREGYQPAIRTGKYRGKSKVCKLTMSNGRELIGTPDHKIFVKDRGFIRLDALRYVFILEDVAKNLQLTNIVKSKPVRIVAVKSLPKEQSVYNLTVANCPEYYANGILVHNCMDGLRYLCADLKYAKNFVFDFADNRGQPNV